MPAKIKKGVKRMPKDPSKIQIRGWIRKKG